MMGASFTAYIGSMAAAASAWAVAQIPVETEIGEWSKLGVSGACLAISIWLIVKTIPTILENNQQATQALRDTMDKGFSELREQVAKGDDRTATLLQSTLTQLFQERRGG